ncbi:helix-turn-helix domain-containing protein [Streptomyces sp. ASQP_92]|uniref:helix-turn-helix domain-containing protein n=1 Tax=Streptomyces sp. ASQP_92 TaxID=2979116 RepID=UPI0021BEEFCD|nr:helix-turn-helix transcriptional regulator [Streptomyces sp. ASQP_92]MCT9087924.1 helix-turn-helix domain-containing protein [Streptomyces sp. ASQP_92]
MGPRTALVRRWKALGYSQERLAQALGVDTTTIGRWGRGQAEPQAYLRPKLAARLHVTLAELDELLRPEASEPVNPPAAHRVRRVFVGQAPSDDDLGTGDLDDMIRREFLRLLTVTGTLAALPVTDEAVPVDQYAVVPALHDVATYTAVNSHLWQIFALAKTKRSALPMVHAHARGIADSFTAAQTNRERRQLCAVVGDLFQLAGEIHFDSNNYTDAAQCYTLAASAGREAGNPDLSACALTRHAFVSIYDGRPRAAASLLTAAAETAKRGDRQLATRHWVAAVQAEVFAGLGDLNGCKAALDRAEEVHALSGQAQNGGWLRFDGTRLAEERGTCYVRLGRLDLAELALADALGQPLSARRRGSVLVDLAALGMQRRDVDQLVGYASQALDLAAQTESGYVVRKLEGLRGRLHPLLSDRRVAALSEQISALAMPM